MLSHLPEPTVLRLCPFNKWVPAGKLQMAIMHGCMCSQIGCILCVCRKWEEKKNWLISRGKEWEVIARVVTVTVQGCPSYGYVLVVSSLSVKKRQSTHERSHCVWCLMVLALVAFLIFLCGCRWIIWRILILLAVAVQCSCTDLASVHAWHTP